MIKDADKDANSKSFLSLDVSVLDSGVLLNALHKIEMSGALSLVELGLVRKALTKDLKPSKEYKVMVSDLYSEFICIGESVRDDVIRTHFKIYTLVLNKYLDDAVTNGEYDFYKLYSNKNQAMIEYMRQIEIQLKIGTSRWNEHTFESRQCIGDLAKVLASETIQLFASKNASKLLPIIDARKNSQYSISVKAIKAVDNGIDIEVSIVFEHGVSFFFESFIVYSKSSLGKVFFKYQTVFKNIVLGDNSKIRTTSAKKLIELINS